MAQPPQQDIQPRIKRHRRDSTLQPPRQKRSFGGDDMKGTDRVGFLFAGAGLNPRHSTQPHATARPVIADVVISTLRQRISIMCDRGAVCYPLKRAQGAAKVRRAYRDLGTNTVAVPASRSANLSWDFQKKRAG